MQRVTEAVTQKSNVLQ